jgi:hypothetical protein
MEFVDLLNKAQQLVLDPNIEGICIKTEDQTISRQIETSEQMVICQQGKDSGSKEYVTDNSVPHPREFTIRGKLSSFASLDMYFVVKPGLVAQMNLLDRLSVARMPVLFKTYYGEFVYCMIKDLQFQQVPNETNVIGVTVILKEFKELVVELQSANNVLESIELSDAVLTPLEVAGLIGMSTLFVALLAVYLVNQ